MKAIEVYGLTRDFDQLRAVDQISFSVTRGEIFGFLGANGAGKTTTIKLLTGQLRPTEGSAKVAGCDIVNQRELLHQRIGVVFERQNLYERLSARDNINFFTRLYGLKKRHAEEVLQMVGLADWATENVSKFSNGMKQRLLIARALLPRPKVVFLDEPTKGLDPAMARAIRAIVTEQAKRGTTIFLTTHYMDEADQMCDSIAIIERGKIVAQDTPARLKAQHGDPGSSLEEVFIAITGNNIYR
jgi:ABC-2 type transport system ATP-binding protein